MLLTSDVVVVLPNGGLKVEVLAPDVKVPFPNGGRVKVDRVVVLLVGSNVKVLPPNGGRVELVEIVLLGLEVDDDPLGEVEVDEILAVDTAELLGEVVTLPDDVIVVVEEMDVVEITVVVDGLVEVDADVVPVEPEMLAVDELLDEVLMLDEVVTTELEEEEVVVVVGAPDELTLDELEEDELMVDELVVDELLIVDVLLTDELVDTDDVVVLET